MESKMLVVVSILSARNFPRRPDCSLLIEAHLNGEVLTSDPVPHSSGVMVVNTELAWEMNKKAFQQHKLHRTPIKLLVFALDNKSHSRQKVGYVMLDLRTAQPSSRLDPSWYGVLNSLYSRLKPQLQVGVSLEDEVAPPTTTDESQQSEEASVTSFPLSLNLDPSGDFYTLGSESHDHTLHTLSFTLSNAQHLPSPPSNQIYFYYNLLGNDITSELFTPPLFSPECASIRIKSSRELLALLFAAQKDVEVHLCSGTDSLCNGSLSLSGLASNDLISVTVPLGNGGCTVDISVKLELTASGPLTLSTQSPYTPSQLPPPTQAPPPSQLPPPSQSPPLISPTSLPSAKRNLTRSFEDASLPTPSLSVQSGTTIPLREEPKSPIHKVSPLSPSVAPSITVTTNHNPSSPQKLTSLATAKLTNATVKKLTGLESANLKTAAPARVRESAVVSDISVRFKFCVDLRSVHNLKMEPQYKCYLKYSYPFFGNPYPVLIQPPVLPVIGTDQQFSHSFCSFEFATQMPRLEEHITRQPLTVEVWQSHDQSHDQIVGLAQIPLGSVLSHDSSLLDGGVTRRVCSLRVPITPPPPSQSHSLTPPPPSQPHTLTLGYLNAVLILENFGPIVSDDNVVEMRAVNESDGVSKPSEADVQSGVGGGGQSLVGSLEYNTAVELELWKVSQQEAFEEQLKTRESAHMTKLGEELQRREAQRQTMLKQKLDHYSSLERQLQDGLQQLAAQQRALVEREVKVRQESERVTRERQLLQDEVQRSQTHFKSQCEQQIEIERMKSSEFQSQVSSLKKRVRELEGKVQSREAEFELYRQQVVTRPESQLHAELSILQLEKVELDRKLSALAKSKQHYKEQWTKALSELASSRQREQAAARERLLTQQQELEAMRMQYMEAEHQNSLRQQLNQVKNEVEKLQEQTLSKPPPLSHNSPPTHSHPTPPTPHDEEPSSTLDPNVARWIEERDILLQTGVYSNTDTTIQRLDAKIRQAMGKKTVAY